MTDNANDLEPQHVSPHDPDTSSAASGEPDAAPPPASDALQEERDRYYDLLLRKTAEFDNFRKRVERERREWTEGAIGDVIADLLPVVDDLERALKTPATGEEADAYRRGVDLILRRTLDVLRKRGVEPIISEGQPFDPHRHQAITYEPMAGKSDGEVIEEFARGYMMGDRLLRPAMVKVAKA